MPFVQQGLKKFLKRNNQKEVFVYRTPCSDTKRPCIVLQAPFQWGCHIHGVVRGIGAGAEIRDHHLRPARLLSVDIIQVESGSDVGGHGLTPRGCGFRQCSLHAYV